MSKVSQSAQRKKIARQVHTLIMRNFTYETDQKQYGQLEHWVMPEPSYTGHQPLIGDCEDFALAARKLLRDRGVKSRLVACHDETGEGHLVLEVDGWILDNRQRKLCSNRSLQKNGYRFLAISGYEPGEPWYKLDTLR